MSPRGRERKAGLLLGTRGVRGPEPGGAAATYPAGRAGRRAGRAAGGDRHSAAPGGGGTFLRAPSLPPGPLVAGPGRRPLANMDPPGAEAGRRAPGREAPGPAEDRLFLLKGGGGRAPLPPGLRRGRAGCGVRGPGRGGGPELLPVLHPMPLPFLWIL